MNAIEVYGKLEKGFTNYNTSGAFKVLGHKDYGRGCLLLVEHETFKHFKNGKAKQWVETTINIEVHEYDSEGFIELKYNLNCNTKSRRVAKKMFENAILDISGIIIEKP